MLNGEGSLDPDKIGNWEQISEAQSYHLGI
jgi:hypothetical protein